MTREYTIGEIAAALQLPVERVLTARNMLPVCPVRRDAAGVAFYDRKALSLFHRLLVENDSTAILEPRDRVAERRYLLSQLSEENRRLVRFSDDSLDEDLGDE